MTGTPMSDHGASKPHQISNVSGAVVSGKPQNEQIMIAISQPAQQVVSQAPSQQGGTDGGQHGSVSLEIVNANAGPCGGLAYKYINILPNELNGVTGFDQNEFISDINKLNQSFADIFQCAKFALYCGFGCIIIALIVFMIAAGSAETSNGMPSEVVIGFVLFFVAFIIIAVSMTYAASLDTKQIETLHRESMKLTNKYKALNDNIVFKASQGKRIYMGRGRARIIYDLVIEY